MIPRKVRVVVGPSVFPSAIGMPRSSQSCRVVCKAAAQAGEPGGPMRRKSSR